jgi:hypothetical protein
MIRVVGINMKQNNQENNNIIFGRLEGLRNTPKGGYGLVLARKAKKGEKFLLAGWTSLGQWLQLTFPPHPFFHVFAKTLYVHFVPTGKHLDIACFFHD